jgi:hypothetical protein
MADEKNTLPYSDYIFAYALEVDESLWGSIAAAPIPFDEWKSSTLAHARAIMADILHSTYKRLSR